MSDMINITVKLFAQYREGLFKVQQMSYPSGFSAIKIIDDIGIDYSKLPIGVLMINGRHIKEDYIVKDGDIFSIFPKVGGG